VALNERLEFPINLESRFCAVAGPADVCPPRCQTLPAFGLWHSLIVGHVIHLTAKSVGAPTSHLFLSRQKDERQRQVGGALTGDVPAFLHESISMAEAKSIALAIGGKPLVSARVGLRGRCSRRERRRFFRELLSSTVTAVFSTCPRPTDSLPAENFYGAYGVFGGDGPACERKSPR